MKNILRFLQNFSRSGIPCSVFLFAFLAVPALQSQTYTLLHSFKFSDGTFPGNGLTVDSRHPSGGNGANSNGTIFKIDPAGKETILYEFSKANGMLPHWGLIRDQEGNMYGTTGGGGTYNLGTVFRLTVR
jgi:uncharacterized repeat protein (TIGR03803 family)